MAAGFGGGGVRSLLACLLFCDTASAADLLKGLARVRVEIRSTIETQSATIKAISAEDLKPFAELALQREGLQVSDEPIGSEKDGEVEILISCSQSVQVIACMQTLKIKQVVFPIRKDFEIKVKGEVQYAPTVVISHFLSGLATMGFPHYKTSTLQELISGHLTSFLNSWRKANPKP